MAHTEDEIKTVCLSEAQHIFDKKNRYIDEAKFIKNLIPKLSQLIKDIYNEDVINVKEEVQYNFKEYDYFCLRADIVVYCESGRKFIIECKNPTHEKAETLNTIGQMIGYQLLFDLFQENTTLILATSIFKFYMAEIIKKHNVEFDIILLNKLGCAYLMRKEL